MREFTRRARLYSSRSLSTLPFRGIKHPCFFLHLPKCGGTSVAAGLYGTVPLGSRIGTIDALATRRAAAIRHFSRDCSVTCHEDLEHGNLTFALREEMLLMHMSWNSMLIHGHVLFSDDAQKHFGKKYKTVTLMRDPYERTISNYRMAVRAGVIDDDLDAWLDSPVAESMARVYLRYLCGRTVIEPADMQRMESLARGNLAKIAMVGFLDELEDFKAQFRALFGATPSIPRYNVGTGPTLEMSPGQHDKLKHLLEPDQRLYSLALERAGRSKDKAEGSARADRLQDA